MSRKGKRKSKSFQPKPTPIDAIMQARQAQRDSAHEGAAQRVHAERTSLAPLRHRSGNR